MYRDKISFNPSHGLRSLSLQVTNREYSNPARLVASWKLQTGNFSTQVYLEHTPLNNIIVNLKMPGTGTGSIFHNV